MRFWMVTSVLLCLSGPAWSEPPSRPGTIICQFIPAEGVSDAGTGEVMAELIQEHGSWHFSGRLNMPSPGYTYQFGPVTVEDGEARLQLELIDPQGAQLAVIDSLDMATDFQISLPVKVLHIDIKRNFHWGPEIILCPISGPGP